MTDYTPQTSASDRYAAARDALDKHAAGRYVNAEGMAEVLATALRALITPPGVGESLGRIVSRLTLPMPAFRPPTFDEVRAVVTAAVRAGIQNAHERWEPSDRPTQEQMLRWLGVKTGDTECDMIFIPMQYIERDAD